MSSEEHVDVLDVVGHRHLHACLACVVLLTVLRDLNLRLAAKVSTDKLSTLRRWLCLCASLEDCARVRSNLAATMVYLSAGCLALCVVVEGVGAVDVLLLEYWSPKVQPPILLVLSIACVRLGMCVLSLLDGRLWLTRNLLNAGHGCLAHSLVLGQWSLFLWCVLV